MDNADPGFRARAEQRRANYVIQRFTDLDRMKDAEYDYWQSQPTHIRMTAAMELTTAAFALKGIHVSRLQRSAEGSERA